MGVIAVVFVTCVWPAYCRIKGSDAPADTRMLAERTWRMSVDRSFGLKLGLGLALAGSAGPACPSRPAPRTSGAEAPPGGRPRPISLDLGERLAGRAGENVGAEAVTPSASALALRRPSSRPAAARRARERDVGGTLSLLLCAGGCRPDADLRFDISHFAPSTSPRARRFNDQPWLDRVRGMGCRMVVQRLRQRGFKRSVQYRSFSS